MDNLFDQYFTGINYWDSKHAIHMWRDFDADVIEEDLAKLEACGITVLRVFPFWPDFQPLTAMYSNRHGVYEYGMYGDHLPDTEAGRAGVSEEMCRRFEVFCDIATKHGMKLIVALLTGHMSFGMFAPPALEGLNAINDPAAIRWELRFVRYFVNRFKDNDAIIAWNPGNEINLLASPDTTTPGEFFVWCNLITDAIRACDQKHPVISGMPSTGVDTGVGSYKDVADIFDAHATHTYNIFATRFDKVNSMRPVLDSVFRCRLGEDISGVPTFMEEFGATGYQNCSQKEESEYYRLCLHSILANGFHGVMWWCAFDQGHFDIVPYDWNNIGSNYGFFDKDGNPKQIVKEQSRYAELKKVLPASLPKCKTDCTIIMPRDNAKNLIAKGVNAYTLAKQVGLNPQVCYALDKIPKSPLYIFPSVDNNMCIIKRRLDEILKHVEEGSIFYMSIGIALFRNLEEIFGIRFHSRERRPGVRQVELNGVSLKMNNEFDHEVEVIDAEVLACDENGNPVYFKRAYGKGYVYLSLLPAEGTLIRKNTVFANSEFSPKYYTWYEDFAKEIREKKYAISDSAYVCLTEHIVDEDTVYIYAINYSNMQETAHLRIKDGYTVNTLYGAELLDGQVTLEAAEASVFMLKRNS